MRIDAQFRHLTIILLLTILPLGNLEGRAEEIPYGRGLTDLNKEYQILDDMEDVSDWYNGSPDETKIGTSDRHVRQGKYSLLFANVVDHTKGEKNYPVGWPRTGRHFAKSGPTDWSAYDFFECWIYVETSREALPSAPLGLGIRHPGPKRSSDFPLREVAKDAWTKITIPMPKVSDPQKIESIQFHIAESNYRHGDRIDFYVDHMVLGRYVEPAISQLSVDRKILYSSDRRITAAYRLVGHKGIGEVAAEFEVGNNDRSAAKTTATAAREGEIPLEIPAALEPGPYRARLSLRDKAGKLVDRKQTEFRVIAGPF